ETAKAVVALPCPYTGTVAELLAEPGETVVVGAPLIRVRDEGGNAHLGEVTGAGSSGANGHSGGGAAAADAAGGAAGSAAGGSNAVLVGYGPQGEFRSRGRAAAGVADAGATARRSGEPIPAVPAARKLARGLGVDLAQVAGSGPDGAITVADVRAVAERAATRTGAVTPGTGERHGGDRETRTPVSGVRKRTAAAMVTSATTIPQASTALTVDCTATVDAVEHLRATPEFDGLPLTPLTVAAAAVLAAVDEYPDVNGYFDDQAQEIVSRHYVNLGVATATERGLLVPHVRDAEGMGLRALCVAIGRCVAAARAGTASPADLTGGTITVTNVGVFGVDTGTALVNPGEAAILCLGAIARRPWVAEGVLTIRSVVTLSLSFDHRLIDGELAARFLARVGGYLTDPLMLLSR